MFPDWRLDPDGGDNCKIRDRDKKTSDQDDSYFEAQVYWRSSCKYRDPILIVTTLQEDGVVLVSNYVVVENSL